MIEDNDTDVSSFIQTLDAELFHEIVVQRDPSGFWEKARDALFEQSIAGFQESMTTLQSYCVESTDMYDYATTMAVRLLNDPSADKALSRFMKTIGTVVDDDFFGGGIKLRIGEMGKVEQLFLFITVHRTRIALAMVQQKNAIAEEARGKRGAAGKKKE